jgi:hypothetical protein
MLHFIVHEKHERHEKFHNGRIDLAMQRLYDVNFRVFRGQNYFTNSLFSIVFLKLSTT